MASSRIDVMAFWQHHTNLRPQELANRVNDKYGTILAMLEHRKSEHMSLNSVWTVVMNGLATG